MHRRTFLAASTLALAAPAYKLIAHRGGVVDSTKPENTSMSLAAAIAEGYWMTEVDIRRTRDGEPILHHDQTLERYYKDPRRPEELSWKELQQLRSTPGNRPPLHFEEACSMCSGKMRLMLDLKGNDWPKEFYTRLLKHIDAAKIPAPLYSLGGLRVKSLFDDRVAVSHNIAEIEKLAHLGQAVDRYYFVFELASVMNQETIRRARALNITPIAAVNTFRYTMAMREGAKRDEESGPAEDVRKLIALGVDTYQIDSRYKKLFV